ncbi:hypothetical protein ADK86_33515 [Streptomyces sp. NRRL F-5755]|uniref:hypothetical protein n=1 Tax=Streptomyces sp. NRRL F-5755 TaxID=1519475 RepID=UPI0006AE7F2A|nr:hypothetical protein [Streptomyces sp. NRRL F-5755]KOT88155.1 hypothetical protein ADK86_33515 [Streptomyces sp. NRRL F-5755]
MRGRPASVTGISTSAASAPGPLTGGVLLETAGGSGHRPGAHGGVRALALVVSCAPTLRTSPRPKGLEAAE